MKTQNTSAHREAVKKSMRLAEFRDILSATDATDMETCVNDLVKNAGLSPAEARVVAAAYRAQALPRIAHEMGIDEEDAMGVMGLHGGMKTTDFAKAKKDEDEEDKDTGGILPSDESIEDEIAEHGHIPDSEEEAIEGETPEMHKPEVADAIEDMDAQSEDDNFNTDLGEVNEGKGETALIQIEVPASEIDAVQQLLDEHFGGGMNAEDNDAMPVKEEAFPMDDAELAVEDPLKMKEEVENPMDAKQLLARKNERAAILAGTNATRTVTAEDETKPKDIGLGKDTSEGGKPFSYAGDAQYKGEDDRPTNTKQNSEGNSLRDQNPSFNKQPIPTNNADNLQLKSGYEVVKKEGGTDGGLEYTVDFNKLDKIPSSDPDRMDEYTVPTQMPETTGNRKTTVAERIVECSGCNNPDLRAVNQLECNDCKTVIAACEDCEREGYCPVCAGVATASVEADSGVTIEIDAKKDAEEAKGTNPSVKQPNGDGFTRKPHEDDESSRKAMALFHARVKTAYSVSYKLALAGVLEPNEVDSNVDMWLSDNLSPATMASQGKLMLKSASSAAERVASSFSEGRNVRTANVSLNPGAFAANSQANEAPNDLREALRSILMPKYEDS